VVSLDEEKELSKQDEEKQELKECIKCGRKMQRDARFCGECGAAQTKDAFLLLIVGCMVIVAAVFLAWYLSQPYSLFISMTATLSTLVILALIFSLLLWR